MSVEAPVLVIIEDEPAHAELAQRAVRRSEQGFVVECYPHGRPALERIDRGGVRLVLLDHSLPGISGLEVLQSLRREGQDVPVIMLTGKGGEKLAVEAMRAGASDYLVKSPKSFDSLPHRIERVLAEWDARREASRAHQALRESEEHLRSIYDALRSIVEGTSSVTGEEFFLSLVRHLASALSVRYALVGELLEGGQERVRTLAVWSGQDFGENFEYDVAGTPCEHVVGKGRESLLNRSAVCLTGGSIKTRDPLFCYPTGVRKLFPEAHLLAELGAESYMGTLLFDSSGDALGILLVLHDKPMAKMPDTEQILRIFAARAGAELERKRTEEERVSLERQLHHAQKMEAVGTLASGIVHDFNNLLMVIRNNVEYLQTVVIEGDKHRAATDMIAEAAQQAMGLTRSLLTFSHRTPVVKSPVDLCLLVEESTPLLRCLLPASIELDVDTRCDPQPWVNADRTQLKQMILNLAINARDAMPDRGKLRVSVLPPADAEKDETAQSAGSGVSFARLVLSDTGVGMSPEVQSRIFDPFFTTKARTQGTGLGLALVHGIVNNHGGRIAVHSRVGQGTTFTVDLPCIDADVVGEAPGSCPIAVPRGSGDLVLLAEDNPQVRGIISSALQSFGYQIIKTADGQAALESFRLYKDRIRLLILDIDLPRGGGLNCLRTVRKTGSTTPAILITSSDKTRGKVMPSDSAVVLHKPFLTAELGRLVGDLLPADTLEEIPL
ncbi:MAG: response regulator [Phycisphaerae bacterium]